MFLFEDGREPGKNSVQTMEFVLKQYDTELISFDLRSEGLDGFVCTSSRGRADRRRKQLWKLIDFRFTRDNNYNLSAWRVKSWKCLSINELS